MGCCGLKRKQLNATGDDRNKCKQLIEEISSRKDTNLQSFKEKMKKLTNGNTPTQKALLIFSWICYNLDYDSESENSSPEVVFQNRKAKCSGFAHLFQDISSFLDLKVECIKCYSKGFGYEPGMQLTQVNHEYNFIKIEEDWYPIDTTWGTGYFEGNNFIKYYNDFYFLTDPERLIKTHFPESKEWQLTNRTYSLKQFLRWPQINYYFYKYGFSKFSEEEGYIELSKNKYTFKVYRDNMENIIGSCSIFLLEGNYYIEKKNLNKINYYKDRFEIDCIFNKKGKYKIAIYVNDDGSDTTNVILKYIVNVKKDTREELYYPLYYKDSKKINEIKPLYNNLKYGEKVKFKIKADFPQLIIIDNEKWINFEKNNGIFEKEIQIQTQPGQELLICNKINSSNCEDLVSYTIYK